MDRNEPESKPRMREWDYPAPQLVECMPVEKKPIETLSKQNLKIFAETGKNRQ